MIRLAFSAPAPTLLRGTLTKRSSPSHAHFPRPFPRTAIIRASSTTVQPPHAPSKSPSQPKIDLAAPPTFQDAIRLLQDYWARSGCLIWQPSNTEVGAGTMNPATFLRVLGPEPWRVAYEEPSIRPDDSRYATNPNRLQRHTQFQVILKPAPAHPQELVLGSYRALGIDIERHDVRFVEDNWQSPALGAWGLGWEVWLDGMEVTQFTYFQQAGGAPLDVVAVEVTYGLERIVMALQRKAHFRDIVFAPGLSYGEIFNQSEYEMSCYNLDMANVERNSRLFDEYEAEALMLLEKRLPIPAYSFLLKASHTFNVLDSRGAVGVTERARFFQRMRKLARDVAALWLERREELGYPLLATSQKRAVIETERKTTVPLGERESFVFEIGMEELPPHELDGMMTQVETLTAQLLHNSALEFDGIQVSGTPRRVAVIVRGLQTRQEDTRERVRGPPLRIALDGGEPTRAAVGFLKKMGVGTDGAEYDDDGYMYATVERKGRSAVDVLSESLASHVIAGIGFGKTMRWNDTGVSFSRPLRWILCLVGGSVVPIEYAGVHSGSMTRTLRGGEGYAKEVQVKSAEEYEKVMEETSIVVCREERRGMIAEIATLLCEEIGARWMGDEKLLDEVVNLVENPIPILGRFDEMYLRLPEEVLVTVMKKHQRYFPVCDTNTGELINAFITVVNGDDSLVDLDVIRAGNEAVLRARYADASFFYENDTKKKLNDFVPLLERLAFQESLGSMLDKTNRIVHTVRPIGASMGLNDKDQKVAEASARLAKADLATSMVIEMTSLAGVMGKHYAMKSGEDDNVSNAIFDAALPRFSGDKLPGSIGGAAVGVADRLDSLIALFGIGLAPKATADPFALRRAALGVVQILIARQVNVSLAELLQHASNALENVTTETIDSVLSFIEKRLEAYLLDGCNFRPDVVKAVLAVHGNRQNPCIAHETAMSMQRTIDQNPQLVALATATHGRAARLLRSMGGPVVSELAARDVNKTLFECDEEMDLLLVLDQMEDGMGLEEKLKKLAEIKNVVDAFFDNVFVNAEDQLVRSNRLIMCAKIVVLTEHLVDLLLLQL